MNALNDIRKLISGKSEEDSLREMAGRYNGLSVFSTSFGLEDQAITHMIFSGEIPIRIFTLDTGRNFPETYSVWSSTLERYKKPIEVFFPEKERVSQMLREKGPNSFYASVENRKECCEIRKVEPLQRALHGNRIWITGIRKEQSVNREGMDHLEWDEKNNIVKFHPLFDWTFEQVKEYIRKNNIPYNALHDRGFPSIGCQPCTRAIKPGEDFRSGRWWWEDASKKECGLHSK